MNKDEQIEKLQATREPKELFADNPINVLIRNLEAEPRS